VVRVTVALPLMLEGKHYRSADRFDNGRHRRADWQISFASGRGVPFCQYSKIQFSGATVGQT
jgi:hypothetical protein